MTDISSSSGEGLALAPEHEAPGPRDVPEAPGAVAALIPPPPAPHSSDSGDDLIAVPAAAPRIMSACRPLSSPTFWSPNAGPTPPGNRAAHARVHSAFPPKEVLDFAIAINGSDLLAVHQQAESGGADISGEEEENN